MILFLTGHAIPVKPVLIINWRQAGYLFKYGTKGFNICIAHIIHHLVHIFACIFKVLLGGSYFYTLYVRCREYYR